MHHTRDARVRGAVLQNVAQAGPMKMEVGGTDDVRAAHKLPEEKALLSVSSIVLRRLVFKDDSQRFEFR